MKSLLRVVVCVCVLLSFNAKSLVINGCTIEPNASCAGADLSGANLSYANLTAALYNEQTIFPTNFAPVAEGMIFVSEVPLPAGIYLFLSGFVGLGLMRGRNA